MKKLFIVICAIFTLNNANSRDLYNIDSSHTTITWHADHFGFSTISGKFNKITGNITFDKYSPHNSEVTIAIDTTQISTGNKALDNHLKSADFFNVRKFPTASFTSNQVITKGRKGAIIEGNLTLLGQTKLIKLKTTLNKIGKNPINQKNTIGFSATAKIKRSDFGMSFGIPGIGDEVIINIESEAILADKNITNELDNNKSKNVFPTYDNPDNQWQIVNDESKIEFFAIQKASKIHGSFAKFNGKIAFDKDLQKGNSIAMTVDTSSVDLKFNDGVETLKSASWLATKAFPKATFMASNFKRLGDKEFIAQGILKIKGKEIATDVNFKFSKYNKKQAIANGYFEIKRSDFGIGSSSVKQALNIEEKIIVNFTISAKKKPYNKD